MTTRDRQSGDEPGLPADSRTDLIRAELASMRDDDPFKQLLTSVATSTAGFASSGGVGTVSIGVGVATALASWIGATGNSKRFERIQEVLWMITRELDSLRSGQTQLLIDEEWAELVTRLLPLIAKTRAEEKRRLIGRVAVTAGIEAFHSRRDEADSMAALTEQLEVHEIRALQFLRSRAGSSGWHQWWGHFSDDIPIIREEFPGDFDGRAILRLQALGCISLTAPAGSAPHSQHSTARMLDLGIRLCEWIRMGGGGE